ncbi:protein ROOT INITIATION DEFECTIVE 3-like [Malania oleifera]|uniref:protein ROOT INITIATION DEFECTIVE 3-like n=1 Tax=Malania oleifera TaxID=397392 RepID=UPI0025AE27B3|nr:protein ROOT INITIATION DEFECTIVE 3-like [Malania oleifera]
MLLEFSNNPNSQARRGPHLAHLKSVLTPLHKTLNGQIWGENDLASMPLKSFHILTMHSSFTLSLALRCLYLSPKMTSSSSPEIVLTSSPDGLIIAFDPSSGATLARFAGSCSPRKGLILAGKTHLAASHISPSTGTGSIHLYNWWSCTAFRHLPLPEPVAPLAATHDGSYLFAGGISGHVHAISLPSGDTVRSFSAHSKPISCLEISFDGSLLLLGADDGAILVFPIFKLVDVSSATDQRDSRHFVLHQFVGHAAPVTAITSGVAGWSSTIASCSLDCTCMFWSLLQRTRLWTVTFPCTIYAVAVDPTESEFYAGGSDGLVYGGAMKAVRRGPANRSRETVAWAQRHGGAVMSLVLINGGRNLVSASEEGSVWVWELERREVIRVLGADLGRISDLVVARGVANGKGGGGNEGVGDGWGEGYCRRELQRPAREISGIEDMLNEVVKDRSKAIDMLESAIKMYERLLELILKEAKGGDNRNKNRADDQLRNGL